MANDGILKSVCPLLQVADLEVSEAFYKEKLGFSEAFRDGTFIILVRDGCEVFLAEKGNKVDLRNRCAQPESGGTACYDLHIFCRRGSADVLWEEYRKAGAPMPSEFDSGPVTRFYGIRDFSVIDPDGYEIVFGAGVEEG